MADEIDARVAQVTAKGASLLLYKDARCDMALLDETVGCMNWKKEYSRDNRNCTVSIWDDEKQQWISKEDTGTESNTEAEKGLASDSFKRACFNWGIGRELYTAPFVWVNADKITITTGKNGKPACYDRFSVTEIGYDAKRRINRLVVVNKKTGETVYTFGTQQAPKPAAVNDNSDLVAKLRAKLEEKRVPEKFVTDAYKVDALEKVSASAVATMLTPAGIAKIVNSYQKTVAKEKQFNLFDNLPDELPYD